MEEIQAKGKQRIMGIIGSIGKERRTKKVTQKIEKRVDKALTELTAELLTEVEKRVDTKIDARMDIVEKKQEPEKKNYTKNQDQLGFVCFHVRGVDFGDPRNKEFVEELLRKFRRALEAVRIEENGMYIHALRVDEFSSQIVGDTLRCAQQVMWNVWLEPEGFADNLNTKLRPLITRHLMKIRLEQKANGKQLTAQTMQSAFGQHRPSDRLWPPPPRLNISMV
jgi:hypothetical protein